MTHEGPNWIAPREGQDWRDEEVLAAVAWLKSFVPEAECSVGWTPRGRD